MSFFTWHALCLAVVPESLEPPRPSYSESFSVSTVEVDDTLNGTITVHQVLYRDSIVHRSWMSANGTLAHGAEEQIMRCDIHPKGWLIVAGGADTHNVTSWSCKNQTIDSDPQHCQWTPFWTPLPANASFFGQEVVDGRQANRWDYWQHGERWSSWASLDGKSPIATGKVWTSHQGYHLWHILWRDFKPDPPPLAAFALTPGIRCGPAPPPSPPPMPFIPASDCKPDCGAKASCCKDPSAPPPGTCFNVKNCSSIHGQQGTVSPGPSAMRTLEALHAAADRRAQHRWSTL
jgi:hypothetical protein